MKEGANICQKADRLASWFLFIWQKYSLLSQQNNFHKSTGLCYGLPEQQDIISYLDLYDAFQDAPANGRKSITCYTVWKQQYTGTTESTEVSKNIYAITYYIPLVLHDSCLEGLHDTVSATSTYLLQYLAWSKFREELCNTWQLFGSISLHDSCKRKCEFAFLGFCLPGFLRSHL